MLSWDEFDAEDNPGPPQSDDAGRSARAADTDAVRRAKAALDALDIAEGLAELECGTGKSYASQIIIRNFAFSDVVEIYKYHKQRSWMFIYILILVVYAQFINSLLKKARRTALSTPFSAYDAELSIQRHRLRTFS